jgi:hypothetical protein
VPPPGFQGAAAASAAGTFGVETSTGGALEIGVPPPTLRETVAQSVSIVPTIYPEDPSNFVIVQNHITINVNSAEFREFNAKMNELLVELRRSNAIAGEVGAKLAGEIEAGMAILRAPKPDPKMVDVLLVRPLRYIADKAAGPVIGACALAALAALGKLIGVF